MPSYPATNSQYSTSSRGDVYISREREEADRRARARTAAMTAASPLGQGVSLLTAAATGNSSAAQRALGTSVAFGGVASGWEAVEQLRYADRVRRTPQTTQADFTPGRFAGALVGGAGTLTYGAGIGAGNQWVQGAGATTQAAGLGYAASTRQRMHYPSESGYGPGLPFHNQDVSQAARSGSSYTQSINPVQERRQSTTSGVSVVTVEPRRRAPGDSRSSRRSR